MDPHRPGHGRGDPRHGPLRTRHPLPGATAPDEARILHDGESVGSLYRQRDILAPGKSFYVIHLDEDWRGPIRVHDRARVRDTILDRIETHPFWG